MNKKWYNPQAGAQDGVEDDGSGKSGEEKLSNGNNDNNNTVSVEKPSLEKAWAYFEHFALSRYVIEEDNPDPNDRKRAEPGEHQVPTRLYSPWKLPHAQLGDFGIGIGLYFSTLRLIFFLTLFSGLVSIANIHFFASPSYQSPANRDSIKLHLIRGSAVCAQNEWVPCPTCVCASDDRVSAQDLRRRDIMPVDRCQVRDIGDGNLLTYALKNECGEIVSMMKAVNVPCLVLALSLFSLIILFFSADLCCNDQLCHNVSVFPCHICLLGCLFEATRNHIWRERTNSTRLFNSSGEST